MITTYQEPDDYRAVLCDRNCAECKLVLNLEGMEEQSAVAAGAKQELPGLLQDPAPFVRFIPGFGDSALEFTLICQVNEFVDQYLVQHVLRKRIFMRFRREGIEIPFPQRTVHIRQAGAAPDAWPQVAPDGARDADRVARAPG